LTTTFQLHERLQLDCISIGRFDLCHILMMNDSQFPWFILVPEKAGYPGNLSAQAKRSAAYTGRRSSYLAENLAILYKADKMNIAAIGNLVPQLHIHHIVRYQTDKAWPAPIWGNLQPFLITRLQI